MRSDACIIVAGARQLKALLKDAHITSIPDCRRAPNQRPIFKTISGRTDKHVRHAHAKTPGMTSSSVVEPRGYTGNRLHPRYEQKKHPYRPASDDAPEINLRVFAPSRLSKAFSHQLSGKEGTSPSYRRRGLRASRSGISKEASRPWTTLEGWEGEEEERGGSQSGW